MSKETPSYIHTAQQVPSEKKYCEKKYCEKKYCDQSNTASPSDRYQSDSYQRSTTTDSYVHITNSDRFWLWVVEYSYAFFGMLPRSLVYNPLRILIRVIVFYSKKYKHIIHTNITQVYPEYSNQQKKTLMWRSLDELAVSLYDCIRIPHLTKEWLLQHVEYPFLKENPDFFKDRPVVLITGHMGSFELMAQGLAAHGEALSYVARNFRQPLLDNWWRTIRQRLGNKVIGRKGALRTALGELKRKQTVGVLFDQNVTRNQAIFVPWFGREAATSLTAAYAAIFHRCPVVVTTIVHLGRDHYRIVTKECFVQDIYENESLSKDQKIIEVTKRMVVMFEERIKETPELWLWIHRRWSTPKVEGERNIYND